MYLAAYHFTGDPAGLLAAHDQLLAEHLPGSDLHVCVTQADGILVLDACPSRDTFDSFSRSPDFHAALRAVGLPKPRIEPLGELHSVTTAGAGRGR